MEEDFINSLTSSFEEKLGTENYALISDDIASLVIENNKVLESINQNSQNIEKLQKEKERLIEANGSLLQSIPMGFEKKEEKKNESENNFKFKDAFDEKGRFRK